MSAQTETPEPAIQTPLSAIAETLQPGPMGKVGDRLAAAIVQQLAAAGYRIVRDADQ